MSTAIEQTQMSPTSGLHWPPGEGQGIWFQGNRMTIKATVDLHSNR